MQSGKQLADALKGSGTGEAKLAICRNASRADTAIEALKKANYFATVRKAEAILESHLQEQAKAEAEKKAKAEADAKAEAEKKDQSGGAKDGKDPGKDAQQPAKPAETKQDAKDQPKPESSDKGKGGK